MVSKNRIEEFVASKKKKITGKGPSNMIVNVEGNSVDIIVKGFLTKLEKESLKVFPELEESFIRPRRFVFEKYLKLYHNEIEDVFGGEIEKAEIKYILEEDRAVINFVVKEDR